jgi:hypothetical protein
LCVRFWTFLLSIVQNGIHRGRAAAFNSAQTIQLRSAIVQVMWTILLGTVVAAIVTAVGWSHGRGRRSDMGTVSDGWVAEHRLSQQQDSYR